MRLHSFLSIASLVSTVQALDPCKIEVVDKSNGWPVPLVQLTATNDTSFVTDNAGVVVFDAPEFMGRETWLTVHSHGYELAKDGFGNRGVRVTPKPGATLKIELEREFGKPSVFGEVWYLEGESPEGPWGPAVKVATHENYTFYNVQIDWQLTSPEEPVLIFEGTYTTSLTDNKLKTPRYDYNQMAYRLDLDDPALKPAQKN